MRVTLSLIGLVGLAATASAFMPASAPRGAYVRTSCDTCLDLDRLTDPQTLIHHPTNQPTGRQTEMILGNLFQQNGNGKGTTTVAKPTAGAKAGSGGRLNLKAIPKDAPKPAASKKAAPAAPAVKLPSFSFGAKKPAAAEPTAKMVNGKLVGYFTEEQVIALVEARREIPSNAAQYWAKVSAKVPGSTPETCKAMANQIALDKARGTGKNFFGGYVEVKETKMVVDESATPMNRLKEAFGLKR